MWQPDGWGFRARIGVLVPHADIVPESEFRAMAPEGVSIHAGRAWFGAMGRDVVLDHDIALDPVRAFSQPPHIDDAAELLAAAPLDVIAYAFTSSSYIGGAVDDRKLTERLSDRTNGIPVIVTCQPAVLALHAVRATRVAVISPPWFSDELAAQGGEYFRSHGFEVVHSSPMDIAGGQLEVHPGQLYAWARRHVPDEADAVFFGGNGLRAVGMIEVLEEDLGRAVLTANQVTFWHALRVAGVFAPVSGYGRLLHHGIPD